MSLRTFLGIILFTDLIAWGAWGVVANTTNPEQGLVFVILFYASLLLALLGLFTVAGLLFIRYAKKQTEVVTLQVKRVFRQSTLLSLLIIVVLVMAHKNILRWWTLTLLIIALGAWEHFFMTGDEQSVAN